MTLSMMNPREQLRQALVHDEGLRLKLYADPRGFWTIGVGRNVDIDGISTAEAYVLLDNDIDAAVRECAAAFPWFAALDPVRQGVLVNMAFNLGIGGLKQFTLTLAAIVRHDYAGAATQMRQSRWAMQVGPRASRLATEMETGAYA